MGKPSTGQNLYGGVIRVSYRVAGLPILLGFPPISRVLEVFGVKLICKFCFDFSRADCRYN